jgi:hypothetical protein
MAWAYDYSLDTPDGSVSPVSVVDDHIRLVKQALQERLNVDHMMSVTGTQVSDTDAGKHRKLTFFEGLSAKPTLETGEAALYTKEVNGEPELFFEAEDGTELQLTSEGTFLLAANDIYLTVPDAAGTGTIELIKGGRNEADDADVAVLPDETRLATDAAPTEDTQVVNKKYVDDHVDAQQNLDPLGAWVEKLNAVVYEAETAGFVTAYTSNGTFQIIGYTDDANPPTTARVYNYGNGGAPKVGITMPVKKGDYWKVTGADTVYWIPLGQ